MIITRTPFRVSFFGGGTDYPTWYLRHGGAVLATTIDKYCYLTCRYLPPFFEHRIRVVYSKIESCQSIDEIAHPAVREVLRHVGIDRGVEIHHDGDLPARSGMGSSSAFTVGLLQALYALKGQMIDKRRLAMEGIQIEQDRLQEAVGSQDQVSAAYGGFNHIVFHHDGEILVRPITVGTERLRLLNDHLMLFFTGIARTASKVAESYVQEMERNALHLQRLHGQVDAGIAILNGSADVREFGELLREAWDAKRSLSAGVTNPEVESLYEEARGAGAIGGKLIGAGGGGFMLLFVPPAAQPRVRERFYRLIHVPFRFSTGGSRVLFFEPDGDYSAEEQIRGRHALAPFRELSGPAEPPANGEAPANRKAEEILFSVPGTPAGTGGEPRST
ncbi:MAG TPA: kinase [bacterium]|nr:kinase [bacterium]